MVWGAQTREPKTKAGLRTDEDGSLLWAAQTRRARNGTQDEDSRQGERDTKYSGTRRYGLRGTKK